MGGDAWGTPDDGDRDRSEAPVHESPVEIATDLVDADCCEYLVEEADRLVVRQSSEAMPEEVSTTYHSLLGIPGSTNSSGKACVIDDALDTRSTASATAASNIEYRSLCCLPVGDDGLLLAKAYRPGAFDENDLALLEQLVSFIQAAFDRTETPLTPLPDGGDKDRRNGTQRLEDIADILSHDLKNPLNVVQGNIELAQQTGDDQYFDNAKAALHRIEELIDEVVFLARTGQLVEEMAVVDLRERVEVAWENVQTEGARLDIAGSVEFISSKRGVCHLLENLIENAIRHAGPAVTVRIGPTETGFFVEDDGPGVPAAYRDEVFDRGFSLGTSSSGLGLHIVQRIVDAHGWDIQVGESEHGGARFEIEAKEAT